MRNAEQHFFNTCKSQLDDSWTVLYEVKFHGIRSNGKNERGDADFVLLHPDKGVFMVEVKGGQEIFIRDDVWYTRPHGKNLGEAVKIKNPFSQVGDAKSNLIDFLKRKLPHLPLKGGVGHFVVFPGHTQEDDLSPLAKRQLICDKNDLLNLNHRIGQISDYFRQTHKLSPNHIKEIQEVLFPTFELIGSRNFEVIKVTDDLKQLTDIQLNAFAMNRSQKQIMTLGGPGTGKTILAINRAKELAAQDLRVIYLCGSKGLANDLARKLNGDEKYKSLSIKTYRELISGIIEKDDPKFAKDMWRTEVTGDQITDKLINAVSEDMMCDALILDEAHNIFKPEAEIIHLLVKPDSYLYVFGDKAQRLRTLNFKTAIDFYDHLPKQTLNINCRNTKEIESVLPQLETQSLGNLGTSGPKPEMYCADEKVLLSHVPQVFARVIKEFGVTTEEVTLITGELGIEKLQELNLKINFGAGKLNVTSPVWFQGMESKIVIALISLDLFKYEISFWDHQHWIEWAMTRDNVSQNAVGEYQIVKEGFRKFCDQTWSRAFAEDGDGQTGFFDFDKKLITNSFHKQISGFLPNFESPELIEIWRNIQMNLLRRISYLTFSRANFHLVNMISTETQKFIQEWNSKNDKHLPFNNFLNQATVESN
jgi:hypothetical protein